MVDEEKRYKKQDDPISLDELKKFLWDAATHLRGQIDAAGYKEYIFPMLFFKRISDVYDEQFDDYVHEGGLEFAKMQASDLAIQIPDGAHWNDVRKVTENVGQALVQAFIDIEQANPARKVDGRKVGGLEGIFGPKDGWTNKNKMPDYIITSLIEDFSREKLTLARCPADEMGQAYEYLIGKFADDAGNTAQEFYTNRTVVELMAEILQPKPDESIYDPTCGSGGMLVKCLDYLRNHGEEWQGVHVYGQEINGITSSIARMNLYLNGVEDFSIVRDDTLARPAFTDGDKLKTFDVVLANPPYSIKNWAYDSFVHDKWGRNKYGIPPQHCADYAFIQHIILSLNDDSGRCAILLPHGVLNRDAEADIRREIVKTDIIECIIGLGRHLFYNSGLESCILICRKKKSQARKGKILFIEAEKYTHKVQAQNYLFKEDIDKIMSGYNSDTDIDGFTKIVPIEDILANNANLNIKSYVKESDSNVNHSDINSSIEDFFNQSKNLHSVLNAIPEIEDDTVNFDFNRNLTIDKSNWRKVKLGDVSREYSERVDNPSQSEFTDFIGSNCIDQYDFTIHRSQDAKGITSAQKRFSKGDYLLVRRSLYGSDFRERAPRATVDGVCSADIITIRENPKYIANGFLIYVLYQKSLWDFIVSNSTGGLTRRIKWKQLANYEFSLPPLSEQKVLSDKLWAAYRLKESYRKLLQATDDMVKAKFIEMIKDKPSTNKLADLVDRNISKAKKVYNSTDEIEYIDISSVDNVSNRVLKTTKFQFKDAPSRAQQCVIKGDILLSTVRPNLKNMAVNQLDFPNMVASTGFCVLRPKVGLSSIILAIISSKDFTDKMIAVSKGTNYPAFHDEDALEYPIPALTPIDRDRITKVLTHAEQTKSSLRVSISSIDKVIKSLING